MVEHDKDASECRSNYRGDQVFECGMMFDSEVWYEYRHSNTINSIKLANTSGADCIQH